MSKYDANMFIMLKWFHHIIFESLSTFNCTQFCTHCTTLTDIKTNKILIYRVSTKSNSQNYLIVDRLNFLCLVSSKYSEFSKTPHSCSFLMSLKVVMVVFLKSNISTDTLQLIYVKEIKFVTPCILHVCNNKQL